MKKQEITDRFYKQLTIENYSGKTVQIYVSTLKLFLEYIEKINKNKITEHEIQNFLYYCKKKKNYLN